ncbi:MAG: TrkH family potassium uptake protein [Candidatus Omnitrophota bacterium]
MLSLPMASRDPRGISLIDSLFTSTSAVCVTGLTVKDTALSFSPFGRWVIFVLFQMGGLGIMTFSTLFAVMLGRKIGFYETDVISSTLDKRNIVGLKKLIFYILAITLTCETLGAFSLFLRWKTTMGWGMFETIEKAVFHSVSAFCNAGFSLFTASLSQFKEDPYVSFIMMTLIFLGGIGFIVIMDVIGLFYKRGVERRISLQSKVALSVSFCLVILGAFFLFFFEKDKLMSMMSAPQKIWNSFFQSITARTAGFNTLSIGQLSAPSMMVMMFLMFIGASPGSTGGGIKTCTFAVLIAAIFAMVKNKKRVVCFKRSIPRQVIREALVIFFLAITWIFIFTLLIAFFQRDISFIRALFEVVSAFGTVGLSTGVTSTLNSLSKLCIIVTMFAGRVGPLTLALAVAFREREDKYTFPEENIMVG